ncbi:MAG: class I SAM-dependent methyltransferase [Planctomycetaceae bacterium]|nr:class I SAM-dependent methyltransferase [Planctomycetaceae bacterium]
MRSQTFRLLLRAAENGRLPDSLIRLGIRRLLRERLRELSADGRQGVKLLTAEFREQCRRGPVALGPELANEQHYEIPAEFFRRILGRRLKYSCCEWSEDCGSLDDAEEKALRTTCLRAGLDNGTDILELGCGWGSLSLWIAEHYPESLLTCVSNSASQKDFILQQAKERNIRPPNVITADMNVFSPPGRFDRIVSVEMFEHMRNHEELLRRISTWLRPDGQLFVHIFCHRKHEYLFEDRSNSDWMARHFFSGGMMPSESLLGTYQRDLTITDQWVWDGRHYQKTCEAWLQRMDADKSKLLQLTGAGSGADARRRFHRWRIFFLACAELFGFENGSEWQVCHYLFRQAESLPSTAENVRGGAIGDSRWGRC